MDDDTMALAEQARITRERSDALLEDVTLSEPLSAEEYRRAVFEARRSGSSSEAYLVRRAQRAAEAREAARRAREPR